MEAESATAASIWPVLLPVIVGGALALLGGVLGPVFNHWLSSRSDNQKKRAERFEELLAQLHQQDEWLMLSRRVIVFGEKLDIPTEPLPRAMAISSLYFPQFLPLLSELESASIDCYVWATKAGQRRLAGEVASINDGFPDMYADYRKTFIEVRDTIAKHAVTNRGKV